METITILKKQQVKEGGRFRIPARPVGATGVAGIPRPATAGGTPQAKVVENTADYAILEVICGCGQTLYIQCNYAPPGSP
jgi:hypothetical protein